MSQPAQFNPLPLLSVMPGITGSLDRVGRDLEQYFAAPATGQDALQNALAELHRVCGVLQMVTLNGVAVYGGEIEKLLQELAAGSLPPSSAHRDIIQRSLIALTHYLDALIDGASNAALRLFNPYQELQQARGVEMSFEVDLFFPELQVELPPSVLDVPQESAAQPRIKAARSQYQQALLKWLRQNSPSEALQTMRTAVVTVMGCVPQDQRRAFWWIATGLLDCLICDGSPPGLNATGLLSRVDMQMKSLLEDSRADSYATTREILYLLARSHAVSEMVDSIKQAYALDDYLPDESSLPLSETAQVLDQMRTQLGAAREAWEKCLQSDDVRGDGARGDDTRACQDFIGQVDQLRALAEGLDRDTLQFLCNQIHSTAAHCDDPERAQRIAQDMAMAMLLLEIGIDQYNHLGSSYHSQARILSQRLQSSMMRMPEDREQFAEVIALHSEMEKRKILAPLATEMQGNLQHVEQGLNVFFNDPGKREEINHMGRLLHQVLAAMRLLALDQAEQLLGVLQQTIERYAAGSNPAPAEMRAVAIALSAMEAYVQNLAQGQKPDVAPLHSALQVMLAAQQPAAPTAVSLPSARPPAAAPLTAAAIAIEAGREDDEDMQEVFLEEAQEVLEILRTNLEISQLHMESREPLITIRRGFHTLKGSGRMVGLTDLGEAAWVMESDMNVWLDKGKPATPALLKFIGNAERLFQAWVDKLGKSEVAQFDCAALLATAQQITDGIELAPTEQPAMELQLAPIAESEPEQAFKLDIEPVPELTLEAKPEPEPSFKLDLESVPDLTFEPEHVSEIDEAINISPELFSISTEEAAQNMAALKGHLATLRENDPPVISYDFMRAAHTLGGVHRAIGFFEIAELAHALELWLLARMENLFTLNEMQLAMLGKVVSALDGMVLAVRDHQGYQIQPELVSQLQADTAMETEQTGLPPVTEIPIAETAFPQAQIEVAQPVSGEPVVQEAVSDRVVRDDLDEQLLPIFLEEADDLYAQISSNLRAWMELPGDGMYGHHLQRTLHTLKGSARMVGAMRLGELTHITEAHVAKYTSQHDAAFWEKLESFFDRIGNTLEQLRSGAPAQAIAPTPTEQAKIETPKIAAQPSGLPVFEASGGALTTAMLRIRSDLVDSLVNEAGEISVARSRIEGELRAFKTGLRELTKSAERLRKQLREIEIQAEGQMQARVSVSQETAEKFDPLEFDRFTQFQDLTRSMNESVHDVQTIQQALLKNLDETTAALTAQAQLNRELQQSLMSVRMVPFSTLSERLYRIIRRTGKELGKKVNLELRGGEVELDRSMLEKMTAPFEHILRNAIDHGLESAEERLRNNKPPIGEIRLSLRQANNEVEFEFTDDGAGLDLDRLYKKALGQGIFEENEVVSESQIMQVIFTPGLSTAKEVTETSGRGVGMDVVRSGICLWAGASMYFPSAAKAAVL